jgi:diguanylate cyclase (GGDEF)-like protein/PAS domain S-box-containing protein
VTTVYPHGSGLPAEPLRRPEKLLAEAFRHAPVPGVVVGPDAVIAAANGRFAEVLGVDLDDLVGRALPALAHPDDAAAVAGFAADVAGGDAGRRLEYRLIDGAGSSRCVALHADRMPGSSLVVCQLIDITEQRRMEQLLVDRATHDPLTGLTARTVFVEQLQRALQRLTRTPGAHVAVLFIDLDRLKQINDMHGHHAGDAALRVFAQRLRQVVRPADVVARLSGDEFAVLVEDIGDPKQSLEIAERLLAAVTGPFEHGRRRLEIRASVGIAVVDKPVPSEVLLAHADAAMYSAKRAGGGHCAVFDEDAYTATVRREQLEDELQRAVANDELILHYQPILDLTSRRVTAVEALLRWQHPSGRLMRAVEFIETAEQADLLAPLAGWIFGSVCKQLADWDAELRELAPQQIFVNVSGDQLANDRFAATIASAAESAGVCPSRLAIEITETQILSDPFLTAATVRELESLGCALVVDDFGTGYSSLSRLTQLPVSALKLDRSFVHDLTNDRRAAAISASVTLLAHNLKQQVIAEGVETEGQLTAVIELGCDYAQGYLIAPPHPAAELAAVVHGRVS